MGRDYKYKTCQREGDLRPRSRLNGIPTSTQKSKNVSKEVSETISTYLAGKREQAIGKLAVLLHTPNIAKIRPILKKTIHDYVRRYRKEFDSSVEIKTCVYELFRNFNLTDFVKQEWQYRPYYIPATEYKKLQTSIKNPVHVTNYDYSQPLYKLANTIDYEVIALKRHKNSLETIKNDIKFYLSQDENVVFSKIVNLKYYPADLVAVRKHHKGKSEEERNFAVYDNYLYNRSLSISMYVLLEGNPKKAMPFLRYDNDSNPHNNIYVGNDKRKEVYGEIALNPHFHFQNENDSLLCLSKNKGRYRTGRCNAIDCAHLKRYLLDLDQLSQEDVDKLVNKQQHYDMPFLFYKQTGKKVGVNVDHLFYQFIQDKALSDVERLKEIENWLKDSKESPIYHNGQCFNKAIRTLDFLDRISKHMDMAIDCQQRKLYSQLEIVIADSLVNSFSNNTSKWLIENYAPKYTIKTDLLEEKNSDI